MNAENARVPATSRTDLIALFLIVISGLARVLYGLSMELHPDEAYYWAWSTRLDWSYYDQGPGVAYYIKFFTLVLGENTAALKLAAVSAGQLSTLFVYLAAREWGLSDRRKLAALALMLLVPGFFGGTLLIMHDSVLLLCWSAGLYLAARFLRRHETATLYLLFAAIGLGALGKHTMAFFALALTLWFILERSQRGLLRNPHLYGAVALAALISTPHIVWNAGHNWDGIGAIVHLRSSGGSGGGGKSSADYIAGQMLSFSPIWALAVLLLAWRRLRAELGRFFTYLNAQGRLFQSRYANGIIARARGLLTRPARAARLYLDAVFADSGHHARLGRLLAWNALVLPLFFLWMSRNRVIQANWAFACYPAIILLVARAWPERRGEHNAGSILFWIGLPVALSLNAFAVFSVELTSLLPSKPPAFLIPGYRNAGYKEITERLLKIRDRHNPDAVIIANKYQDAAIAHWYMPEKKFVGSLNITQRNQYSYWPVFERGRDYIIFETQENPCLKMPLLTKPALDYMFESVEELGEHDVRRDGMPVKRFQAWYGKNLKRHWDERLVDYLNKQAIFHLMPSMMNADEMGGTDSGAGLFDPEQLQAMLKMMMNTLRNTRGEMKTGRVGILDTLGAIFGGEIESGCGGSK